MLFWNRNNLFGFLSFVHCPPWHLLSNMLISLWALWRQVRLGGSWSLWLVKFSFRGSVGKTWKGTCMVFWQFPFKHHSLGQLSHYLFSLLWSFKYEPFLVFWPASLRLINTAFQGKFAKWARRVLLWHHVVSLVVQLVPRRGFGTLC